MKHPFTTWSSMALGGLLLFSACSDLERIGDIEDIEIQADYAVPVFDSKNTILDLIEAGGVNLANIGTTPDGVFEFTYQSEGPGITIDEIFDDIPDFPFAILEPSTTVSLDLMDDVAIHKMDLTAGSMTFNAVSAQPEDISVTVRIPSMVKNNLPLELTIDLTYDGTLPVTVETAPIDISGYRLTTDNQAVTMEYTAVNTAGNTVAIEGVGGWSRNWAYDYIEGVYDSKTLNFDTDTLDIDLFEAGFTGDLIPADPQLLLHIDNSFGFDALARINSMVAFDENGLMMRLSGDIVNDGFMLQAPGINEVGTVSRHTIVIDNNNSNIVELMAFRPVRIVYELGAIINPDNTTDMNFITNTSQITSDLEAAVPFHGQFNMNTQQTADVDFGQPDELTKAVFTLTTENELPLNLNVQFYFHDNSGNIIDSLFTQREAIIDAAPVDANGLPTAAATNSVTIEIDDARLQRLDASEEMTMDLDLVTTNDGEVSVVVTPDQTIDIKLGAILSIEN